MKKLSVLTVLTLCSMLYPFKLLQAQEDSFSALYLTVELGPGNFFFGGYSLKYIHNHTWSFQLGYYDHLRDSKAMPDAFVRNTIYWSWPEDQMSGVELLVGKIISSEEGALARFNLQAGLAFTKVQFHGQLASQSSGPLRMGIRNPVS